MTPKPAQEKFVHPDLDFFIPGNGLMGELGSSRALARAMTNHTDHMSLLSRELELRSKQKRGREAAIRLRASGLDIPEGSTLFGVVALCHGSDSAPAISSGATQRRSSST